MRPPFTLNPIPIFVLKELHLRIVYPGYEFSATRAVRCLERHPPAAQIYAMDTIACFGIFTQYFMLELTNFVSDTAITNMPAKHLNNQLKHKAE